MGVVFYRVAPVGAVDCEDLSHSGFTHNASNVPLLLFKHFVHFSVFKKSLSFAQ